MGKLAEASRKWQHFKSHHSLRSRRLKESLPFHTYSYSNQWRCNTCLKAPPRPPLKNSQIPHWQNTLLCDGNELGVPPEASAEILLQRPRPLYSPRISSNCIFRDRTASLRFAT